MKQVVQSFKTGKLEVKEVPWPQLSKGYVLVENKASLISSGTERGTVQVAKANLLDKARQRPDLVAQVLQNVKKEGLKSTFDKVRTKLDSPKALGYSSAGIVKVSMDANNRFKQGDRVICAGQDLASHAEVVAIPQNLVAKIPQNVSFEEAAFTTLGAIALQGVRQANVQLGDNVCVIGLGLLGQLTSQLLKASGCHVFGVDLDKSLVDLAITLETDGALERGANNLIEQLHQFTDAHGFDKIIITASTKSNDPISLAAEIATKKGLIVIVGAVGMQLERDPHFYKKELSLKMSCSYGPGRYDTKYEELGADYPYAYVRWTEQRNMEAFLQMVAKGAVKLEPLISHVFDIDKAKEAYKLVSGEVNESSLGIILKYPEQEQMKDIIIRDTKKITSTNDITASFIGAGSFAQSYLIPNVKNIAGLGGVLANRGINAEHVARKFGFTKAVSEISEIIHDDASNVVFVATLHNTHAQYVEECLIANKHVFVEKPLAINEEELQKVADAYEQSGAVLAVGFNRRFSEAAKNVKRIFSGSEIPMLMNFRVNAGALPEDHWSKIDEIGGGRIIGEVCHFIDLMQYISDSEPVKVYAEAIPGLSEQQTNTDNVAITISFNNGSVGTITYASNGDKSLPKENLEFFAGEKAAVIHDFNAVTIYQGSRATTVKTKGKGHKQEVEEFLKAVKTGKDFPITFNAIYKTTLATFKCMDSLATGLPQWL